MKWITGAWRCIQAQLRWFKTGSVYSEPKTVLTRLEQCVPCEFNQDNRCSRCSCPIMEKVTMESEFCPISKW